MRTYDASGRRPLHAVALLIGALSASLFLASCEEMYGIRVKPQTSAVVRQRTTVDIAKQADILFVIDNSGSMEEEQDNIALNFQTFIDEVKGSVNDFHIGIITTDMDTCEGGVQCLCRPTQTRGVCGSTGQACALRGQCPNGGPACNPGDACDDGSQCPSDDEMCPDNTACPGETLFPERIGGGRLVSNADAPRILVPPPNPEGDEIVVPDGIPRPRDEDQLVDWFQKNIRVGIQGCGFEKGLEAARQALTDPNTREDGPNAGFLRRDAILVVIFVTDEDDCSHEPGRLSQERPDECFQRQNLLYPFSEYATFFRSIKGTPNRVALASIVGAVFDDLDGDGRPDTDERGVPDQAAVRAADCIINPATGDPQPPGGLECDPEAGGACAGGRYAQVTSCFAGRIPSASDLCPPEQAGAGFVDSICRSDFAQTMLALGNFVKEQTAFCLRDEPRCLDRECRGELLVRVVEMATGVTRDVAQCCDEAGCAPRVSDDCFEYKPTDTGSCPEISFRGDAKPDQGDELEIVFVVDPTQGGNGGGGASPSPSPDVMPTAGATPNATPQGATPTPAGTTPTPGG